MLALQCRRATCGLQAGFTLIELMVVLLVMAILLTIAIPTFLGVSRSAGGRGSQANLNTALIESNSIYQANGDTFGIGSTAQYAKFGTLMATSLSEREPNLGFTTSTTTGPSSISLSVSRWGERTRPVRQVPLRRLLVRHRASPAHFERQLSEHQGTLWPQADDLALVRNDQVDEAGVPHVGLWHVVCPREGGHHRNRLQRVQPADQRCGK